MSKTCELCEYTTDKYDKILESEECRFICDKCAAQWKKDHPDFFKIKYNYVISLYNGYEEHDTIHGCGSLYDIWNSLPEQYCGNDFDWNSNIPLMEEYGLDKMQQYLEDNDARITTWDVELVKTEGNHE